MTTHEVGGEDCRRNREKDREDALNEWIERRFDDFIRDVVIRLSIFYRESCPHGGRLEVLKQEAIERIKKYP